MLLLQINNSNPNNYLMTSDVLYAVLFLLNIFLLSLGPSALNL